MPNRERPSSCQGDRKNDNNTKNNKDSQKNTRHQQPHNKDFITPRPKSSHTNSSNRNFQQTSSKLMNKNFQHHGAQCLCESCTCGRHLYITKRSTYKNQFGKTDRLKIESKPLRPFSAKQIKQPNLGMTSTYRDNFHNTPTKSVQKPRPKDELAFTGPSQELSSYKNQYPGHKGKNQYVPVNPELDRGGLEFKGNTTNSIELKPHPDARRSTAKNPDLWNFGSIRLCQSGHKDQFKKPDPKYFAKQVKVVEKRQINPDYNCQFSTTYRNNFFGNQSAVCPAKKMVESGFHQTCKSIFKQNGDFRGMKKDFQPFSNSKFSYT